MWKPLKLWNLFVSLIIVALDQMTKIFILENSYLWPKNISSFLNIILLWNSGVLFGVSLFQNPILYIGLSALITAVVIFLAIRTQCKQERWAFSFVIGGAIGNIIDRFRFYAVVDFIDVYIGNWHWPAFNVADIFICLGATWLLFLYGRQKS